MGKKSRLKKERKDIPNMGKMMKEMKRESKIVFYKKDNGNLQCFNPVKRLMQAKMYVDENGKEVLQTTISQYASYMKQKGLKVNSDKELESTGEKK